MIIFSIILYGKICIYLFTFLYKYYIFKYKHRIKTRIFKGATVVTRSLGATTTTKKRTKEPIKVFYEEL